MWSIPHRPAGAEGKEEGGPPGAPDGSKLRSGKDAFLSPAVCCARRLRGGDGRAAMPGRNGHLRELLKLPGTQAYRPARLATTTTSSCGSVGFAAWF